MAKVPYRALGGMTGALALAAIALVMPFEGKHLIAYLDPPGIPTICYGHTSGVTVGRVATEQECDEYLKEDLGKADRAVLKLVKVPLTDERRAALISFVYNAGEGNFARSSMLRKLNAGDTRGACAELSKWVYAGGKKLQGLVRRRAAERELCERGLAQ